MLVGYARVSTQDQNLGLQQDALSGAGCKKIFEDVASGAKASRTGLEETLAYMREGDTLVVWKLDRVGRSLKQLIEVINQLHERGIGFKSIQESIDTTTPGGKLIFHVFGALAESENPLNSQNWRNCYARKSTRKSFVKTMMTSLDWPIQFERALCRRHSSWVNSALTLDKIVLLQL